MGKVRQFGIIFDGDVNLFSQGDVIKGQAVLEVDREGGEGLKNVKGIWVRFQGKAKTKWTTRSNKSSHTHTLKECYFDTDVVVFGTGKLQHDVRDLSIPSGRTSFPFQFQLPMDPLPSPFEGRYGYVRYRAKATVSLIRTFVNKTFKFEKLFSIVGPTVDLNANPATQEPVNSDFTQFGCCGCGNTAESIVSIGLPKQGYVPGESIYVIGRMDNRDGEEFGYFNANLTQYVTFRSANNTIEKKYVLVTANSRVACPRGRVTDFTVGPLRVPPVPPSGLIGCHIIDIQYLVKVDGSGCSQKFTVVIGTVPHRAVTRVPHGAVTQVPSDIASAPPENTGVEMAGHTQVPGAPPYQVELPPPSYTEAVGVIDRLTDERDREDYFSQNQFVPRYPYFDLTVDVPPTYQP